MNVLLPHTWEQDLVEKLNVLFGEAVEVTPERMATELVCEYSKSLQILVLLYHWNFADWYLQVYHATHKDAPILTLSALSGLPAIPITCSGCGNEILDRDDLRYTFLFKTDGKITFVTEG